VKPDGTPASYTKPQRLFDRHQKQALLVAARGRCEHTGCTNPWVMLTADHKRPNARGGPTSVENGQILCDACNKDKADRLD
jgi:5-methylcytosine-specific restriction endonuclease McrA